MLALSDYLDGPLAAPRILQADAYTIGSGAHVSDDAKACSVYHVVPRRGFAHLADFVDDDRIVFYGLRRIIRELLTDYVTQDEIDTAELFLKTFHAGGVPFHWDKELWQRVVAEHRGVIPIKIEALPAGQVAFPGEPVMQITSAPGFGELANYFESTLLKVWATSERVTMLRWWKHWLEAACKNLHPHWPDEQVDATTAIMCHDFGDRAGSCVQESEVLGQAHCMVFPGTDTVLGAFADWADTWSSPASSIHALAHRTVMGYESELEAHEALYHLGQSQGITAHVSDTYDFFRTVERLCEKLAADPQWQNDTNVLVLRPDSGDPVECVLHILKTARRFGVEQRVRWIQGDSMNWTIMQRVIAACVREGFSPFATGAFGVGGHLRNSIARDHTGLSMKLAAVGPHLRPVCKRSHTAAKASIPGVVKVLATDNHTVVLANTEHTEANRLVTWYDGITAGGEIEQAIKEPCLASNDEVRQEIREGFLVRNVPAEVLSPEVQALRDQVLQEQDAAWEVHA